MARKIYYKIVDDGRNMISDGEWEKISRLQHWYNSEFMWTAGRLTLKMYAVFPNPEGGDADKLWHKIMLRRQELEEGGMSENEAIRALVAEGLVIAQKGGYYDKCIASGFTRVAGNEFNSYLVCDFLIKVSRVAENAAIDVYDEGEFIKAHQVRLRRGDVILSVRDESKRWFYDGMVKHRHAFAIVDSGKYDNYPRFQSTILDFNDKTFEEKLGILRNWNWLGFENNFDLNGDDIQGSDLNQKVDRFILEDFLKM